MSKNGEELLAFAQEKLRYIERYINLIKNNEITPELLNHAIATYSGVNTYLISQQTLMENDYEELKEEYDIVWGRWYLQARDKINVSRVPSKLAANPEIEAEILKDHLEEYKDWKARLRLYEKKVALYTRLVKAWEAQGRRLDTLGFNLRAEMKALPIDRGVTRKIVKQPVTQSEVDEDVPF